MCTSIGRYLKDVRVLVSVDTETSSVYVGIITNLFETRGIERNNFRPFSSKSEHFENLTPVQGFQKVV